MAGALQRVAARDVCQPLGHSHLALEHLVHEILLDPRRKVGATGAGGHGKFIDGHVRECLDGILRQLGRQGPNHVSAQHEFDDDPRAVRQNLATDTPAGDEEQNA
ncbi:hypothetical protein D9M72_530870 [compost metagenome]